MIFHDQLGFLFSQVKKPLIIYERKVARKSQQNRNKANDEFWAESLEFTTNEW